ncbi:AAA family ATPase [Enterovirga aerilata]|uniref:ATP-binding protein n=1 Tax=Enterovirga aerilata TaxID=2730920 RepID=A0A849I400_9HYPH|nr:AAA family ATPase [Enterovirga sp. DB1703]NNM72088.1 ATP-binding protein [Enterovirga sp. DB1703]
MRNRFELPLASSLAYVDLIFIRHGGVQHANSILQNAVDFGVGHREAFVGYVKGFSRCGKTETTKRFIEQLTGVVLTKEPIQLAEGKGRRVLYVEVVSGGTVLGLCQAVLRFFSDLRAVDINGNVNRRLREQDATRRLVEILALNDIDLAVLDEFQNTFRHDAGKFRAAAASMLITLQNGGACPVVVTGTNALDELFAYEDALDQRKDGLAFLEPFALVTEADKKRTRTFVRQFVTELPFEDVHDLFGEDDALRASYFAFRGRPGILTQLCGEAAKAAFKRAGAVRPKSLTVDDFADGFDFFLKHDRKMLGINPFRAKKLPPFPLAVDKPAGFTASGKTGNGLVRTLVDG